MVLDVVNAKQLKSLDRFRKICSQKQAAFLMTNDFNAASDADLVFPNLILLEKNKILASFRLEVLWTWKDFDDRYQGHRFLKTVKFPCLYINHVYTHPTKQRQGYNALLRYYSFRLAKKWGMRSVLGDMLETSPRVSTLQKMGYKAFPHPVGWKFLGTTGKVLTLYLDFEKNGKSATQFCRKMTLGLSRQVKASSAINKLKAPRTSLRALLTFNKMLA